VIAAPGDTVVIVVATEIVTIRIASTTDFGVNRRPAAAGGRGSANCGRARSPLASLRKLDRIRRDLRDLKSPAKQDIAAGNQKFHFTILTGLAHAAADIDH
jgi:hypothetical protein